jgi:hypothetical protein
VQEGKNGDCDEHGTDVSQYPRQERDHNAARGW